MNKKMLLQEVLEGSEQKFPLNFVVLVETSPREEDAVIQVQSGATKRRFRIEVKQNFVRADVGPLLLRARGDKMPLMLITDYVNPKLAETLVAEKIPYLDLVGNAFFEIGSTFIDVRGKSATRATLTVKRGKELFSPAGLKLVYALLTAPDLVKAPYRRLAQEADVAVGTITRVFAALKDQGYLTGQKKQRKLIELGELLNRWQIAYANYLRNSLILGQYKRPEGDLSQLDLTKADALWGGEIAAERMTDYLRAEKITIYIHEGGSNLNRLTYLARLLEESSGEVEVLRAFWLQGTREDRGMVHPVLVYADLMASGDPRNVEAAKMIYDGYLAGHLE